MNIVILAGPLIGVALAWPAERVGAWLIAVTMAGSLVFGLVNHFGLADRRARGTTCGRARSPRRLAARVGFCLLDPSLTPPGIVGASGVGWMPEGEMGRVSRRDLLKTAAGVGTVALRGSARAQGPTRRVRVAAVQMHAALGEVAANLENAEHWVRLAIREGAQWIVLPEFFTTAIALHPTKLVNAYRTLEGLPMQLLKTLAKEGHAYVSGSFLARSGADVFNTFVLASPDGQVYTHDKDFPTTNIETSVYAGGEDDEFVKELTRRGVTPDPPAPIPSRPGNVKSAVFALPDGISAGAALCWEQCRYRTARRLAGKVDLILAASGWPFVAADGGISRSDPASGHDALAAGAGIREAPRRLARLAGAPVVHASLVGDVWNSPPNGPAVVLRFSGESQIADASGRTIARRGYAEGEGLVIAEIEIGRVPPSESIPDDASAWTPEVAAQAQTMWAATGAAGRAAYLKTTRPRRNG